ncbi:MAG: hypothetical protein IT423_08990 [Pirellulaceae bacterium]|nr:hypothetical protein [Pirellulaceae bacterium]
MLQLDKTEIAIRGRSTLELLDLSLLVIRRYWWQLLTSSAVLGLPLLALNVSLIGWMLGEQGRFAMSDLEQPEMAMQNRYLLHLFSLWFLEFPLASLPATVLIGNQIFFEKLSFRRLLSELRPLAWRAVLVLGVLRLGLMALPLELLIVRDDPFNPFLEIVMLVLFFCGWSALRRASAPYAPEILGLESCRLRLKKKGELTYWRRSRSLHGPIVGDCIGRFMTSAFVAAAMVVMLYSLTLVGDFVGVRRGKVEVINSILSNRSMLYTVLPLTMWLAGIYVTVFRFLTYLDSRIRLEGWEVELQLKAERTRLLAAMNVTPEGQLLQDEAPVA